MESTPRINWRYQFQQYGTALLLTAFFCVIFSVYLYFRRGYYDLYIANKVLANVSGVLLGIVLLMGPFSRWFVSFASKLQYRKEIGIVAFFLALAHAVISFFFLPDHFSIERYIGSWNWPFVFGLTATVVLLFLFLISFDKIRDWMGLQWWWRLQNWGVRLGFVLVALHVLIMKKKGWLAWYQEGGGEELVRPDWPGAGLLVGWFLAYVLLVRLAEIFGRRVGKLVCVLGTLALLGVYIFTFWWGANLDFVAPELDEEPLVEDYIRENISELSPVSPVLGGTWYVVSVEFLEGDSVLVVYEDGHIQESFTATYQVGQDGLVQISEVMEVEEETR